MNESRWQTAVVSTALCFVAGLLLFLSDVYSTGEAPQRFQVTITWSPVSIAGAAFLLVAVGGALILSMRGHNSWKQNR
jgi:lysylphosphatidylglycerol synthetase-like protein (DUF2156 family)